MAAVVSTISPPRGRTGTVVVVTGTGFNATPGQNQVKVDGQTASISVESATSITFTVPGSITLNRHVVVRVTNLGDGTYGEIYWFSKDSATNLKTQVVPGQVPGPDEDPAIEDGEYPEAQDYERLVALIEELRDGNLALAALFTTKGDLAGYSGSAVGRQPAGTDGYLLAYDSTKTLGLDAIPPSSIASSFVGIFGDGSDGDVTISGPTTLTRDMYYNNLTVNNGITLNTGGFRIFVRDTLTLTGTAKISRNGNPGASNLGGAGLSSGTLGGSGAGGNASTVGTSVSDSAGGSGGAGQAGSAGGTASAPSAADGGTQRLQESSGASSALTFAGTKIVGGAGGGGGAPTGGGGSGGGVIMIAARYITGAGTVEAIGGAGEDAFITDGGGGGGGAIVLLYETKSGISTSVAGGVGGGGGGSPGSAGNLFEIDVS